jgi:hypothetical protein
MNVEIRAEAAQFPEKEYINGIAFAVYKRAYCYIHMLDGESRSNILRDSIVREHFVIKAFTLRALLENF